MASLVHPERFQSEVALNLVRNLLGWGTPAFAGRIRAGEFVLFVSYLSFGLALLSGTIIRGTLKTPNSQLVTPISIKLQRPDGSD
jgi:hypothetical protein